MTAPMPHASLVEALEHAYGLPQGVSTGFTRAVIRDADTLFRVLARFASPEAKREVAGVLVHERLGEMMDADERIVMPKGITPRSVRAGVLTSWLIPEVRHGG